MENQSRTARIVKISFRIVLGSIVTFMVGFVIFGIWLLKHRQADKTARLELRDEIAEVYQKDPHDITWWVAVLKGSGRDINLEKAMIHKVKAGDSIFKKKGDSFYFVKSGCSGRVTRYWLTQ